jgi:hypothetical protein
MPTFDDAAIDLGVGVVHCPEPDCAVAHVRLLKVVVNAGGSTTTVSARGTTTKASPAAGRGVSVELHLEGRCGHRSILTLQSEEERTQVDVESLLGSID